MERLTTPVASVGYVGRNLGDNCDLDSQLSDWSSCSILRVQQPSPVVWLSMRNVTENVDQIIPWLFS